MRPEDKLAHKKQHDQKKQEQEKREKQKQDQLISDRLFLLRTAEFQRVMNDILTKGGMFRSVMTGNSMTFYNAGKQDFARQIWSDFALVDEERSHDLLKPKFEVDRNAGPVPEITTERGKTDE